MRIERTGKIEALTPRVERFIVEALGGKSLDEIQSHGTRRADYLCLRGLLAIELKSLEDSGEERMDNLVEELRKRPDWPMFFGSAPMQAFIDNTDDPENVGRAVAERVSRGVLGPLRKANKQLEAHANNFPRRSQVRMLVLVNEDHEIYDPHTVSFILWHAVRRLQEDQPLYPHVDAILYITERHAMMADGRVVFPCVSVESPVIGDQEWKGDVIDLINTRWGRWNFGDARPMDADAVDISKFTTIDHIPDTAPRHERWRTDYRRNPYLRPMTKGQLHERFDEIMVMTSLSFLNGSPQRLPQEGVTLLMEQMTHMMLEMGERAIPVTDFDHGPDRVVAAAGRLNLAQSVIDWLIEIERDRVKPGEAA